MENLGSLVEQMNLIDKGIQPLFAEIKKLRKQRTEIENRIKDILDKTQNPGFKTGGKAFVLDKKERNILKSKADQYKSIKEVLINSGVKNADKIIKNIDDAKIKETTEKIKLKITKLKK